MCQQTGAEIWLWYYPETHYWYMFDLPNIYNVYYDIKWLNEHGVTGFFYEGSGGAGYWFEIVGLGSIYLDNYVNGTPEQAAEYEARYTEFHSFFINTGMRVSSYTDFTAAVPDYVDLSYNPSYFYIPAGSWRANVQNLLGEDGW